jgi:DNA-directed RNA polymerase specialized sigma24 family protein
MGRLDNSMRDSGFPAKRAAGFATTRWSLVLAAGQPTSARSAEALASLCELYWYPVYAFIRRQGYRAEDGADLTQAFFARVLEKNYFHDADPARGRFRAFLCASIRHFLSNERDRARALKRGGNQPPISLDLQTAEGRYQFEPRDDLTPEKLFDRHWALMLLERVLARLRDEHVSAGKADLFDLLNGFLTGDSRTVAYGDVAKTSGMTEGAVKVAVHRLRRRFRDALVQEIAETVSDPGDIDAEIEYLLKAVRV